MKLGKCPIDGRDLPEAEEHYQSLGVCNAKSWEALKAKSRKPKKKPRKGRL